MNNNPAIQRTSIQLYRDCLRLVKHMAGQSSKAQSIRAIVRGEFEKSRNEEDPEKIMALKANAIRGLSNYLVYANASKDERIHSSMKHAQSDTAVKHAEWESVKREDDKSE